MTTPLPSNAATAPVPGSVGRLAGPLWPLVLRRARDLGPVVLLGLVAVGVTAHVWAQGGPVSALVAVLVAGFLASLAGFAFSAICGAALFHLVDDPHRVVEIMLLCSLSNQTMATWSVRRGIRMGRLLPFLVGGAVGVPLGVAMLLNLRSEVMLELMGGLMVGLAVQQYVARLPVPARTHRGVDVGCGVLAGVLAGFAASPGVVVAVRSTMKPWDKVARRAVLQPMIMVLQLSALLWVAVMRPSGGVALLGLDNLAFVPVSLLGTCAGLAIFHQMTDRQFGHALNATVLVSGVSLIV